MNATARTVACTCALLADEKKAEEILVLHVGPLTAFTDYFVIATGQNDRQIQAIAESIRQRAKKIEQPILGIEGEAEAGWVLIDLGGVVVHLFNPEARKLYDLELLWGEADETGWQEAEALGADAGERS